MRNAICRESLTKKFSELFKTEIEEAPADPFFNAGQSSETNYAPTAQLENLEVGGGYNEFLLSFQPAAVAL